jgi:ribosomal protein S27E
MFMATEYGFIKCGDCGSRAVVLEFGGQKAGTLYTKCSGCGTTSQGCGIARQEFLRDRSVKTVV